MAATYLHGAPIEDVLGLARGFQAASVWRDIEIDDAAVRTSLVAMADTPSAYLLVTPTGMVGGLVMPLWFAPATKLDVELFWYSDEPGEGPSLRNSFERWARSNGASAVQ